MEERRFLLPVSASFSAELTEEENRSRKTSIVSIPPLEKNEQDIHIYKEANAKGLT